jgi:hypothetical protein
MKHSKHNSKNLHIHAIPVIITLFALTFLVGGMVMLTGGKVPYKELGRALTKRSVTLTSGSDGTVHLGLARAVEPTNTPDVRKAPPVADAQVGLSASLQQTVDQTVVTTSY